ncbi:hypothetical protein [Lentibacillus salinarum]|uniref:Uncharacterized protein n=1 Tax=Lentibacillus salinarum TaxID=446820 RepID=A0ABW3ZZ78_9BACI
MTKNEQGFSTIEFLIGAVLMTFIIFFPIVTQMQMHAIQSLEQELNRTLQMAAVQGSVTPDIKQITEQNLADIGVENVSFTPETTSDPVERGGTVHVGIIAERPQESMFSGVMGLIGGDDIESDTFVVEGSIMSEYLP